MPPAGHSGSGMRGSDHPITIDLGKPSRPGPRGQGRSVRGALHLDPEGQVCSPHGRVDGDGMIRQAVVTDIRP